MHKLAGVLLIIAFILDLIAGMAYVAFGALGGGMLAMLGALGEAMVSLGGESAESLPFMEYAVSFGGGLAAAGLLVIVAGVLAVLAGARLIDGRTDKIVYVGAAAAIVADAVPLAVLGFNPFQIPGLLGGMLGLLAGHQLSHKAAESARQATSGMSMVLWISAAVVAFGVYWYTVGPTDRSSPTMGSAPSQLAPAALREMPKSDGEVTGQLAGVPFEPQRIYFEGWVFHFHQREDLEVSIHLNIDDGELPVDLELVVDENSDSFDSPTIFIDTPESGNDYGKSEIVQGGYRLRLVTGPLTDNRIPGRIEFELDPSKRTRVIGDFESRVEGRVDIEPDLSRAGLSAFRYLGFQHLKQTHAGMTLDFEENIASYQTGDAAKSTQYGHTVIVYRVDEIEHFATFQLHTRDGRWEIVRALEPGQLAAAHPLVEPEPDSIAVTTLAAARHVETWLNRNHSDRVPWSVTIFGSRNMQLGRAALNAEIHLRGDDALIKRRLYLEREKDAWRYVRDLADNERFKSKTGEIVVK